MAAPFPNLSLPGLTAAGGSCDYPSASDVRMGVEYSFGTLVGTLFVEAADLPSGSTLRERGQRLFKKQMRRSATRSLVTVTYKRGATTVDISGHGWVGNTRFSRMNKEDGPAVVYGDRDYIVAVDALPFEPARGDRIIEVENSVTTTYEVMGQPAEPEYRYSDPSRTHWRIHVKEVR